MEHPNLLESPHIKNVHMIGIGGSSMSGLAEILKSLGYTVSGSDDRASDATEKLQKMGISVRIGLAAENIQNPDLVVYTVAVKDENPELIQARSLGVPVIDRATLLGLLTERYQYSIGISGTHGKTTTTSMVSMIMLEADYDPTIHIGGVLESIGSNIRVGKEKYFITEADEYYRSFLKLNPFVAVLLNIELDHVDYYKSLAEVKDTFLAFASLVPENGYVVACADDANIVSLLDKIHCRKITYSVKTENASWYAAGISCNSLGHTSYTLIHEGRELGTVRLGVPGMHNVSNSLAAIATCYTLGCGIPAIQRAMEKFGGANKRFELKGTVEGIKVIDDYAHHPTEVKVTLKAAKCCEPKKLWCVFQPHTYTRVKAFLQDFADALTTADAIIVSDIYAAREPDRGEIHASALAEKLKEKGKDVLYIHGFDAIVEHLKKYASRGDLIITMGAGDISKVGEMFLKSK